MSFYRMLNDKPNTRLFILGARQASEKEWKDCFSKYGEIKDMWMVRESRDSDQLKGITYITYGKTSEAALAMEEMNGRCLANYPKPIKVIMATDKKDANRGEYKEDEKMERIFIMVPKTMSESEIEEEFKQWGEIDYVRILKNQNGENKGLAYVKFHRAYHAALAVENCEEQYKAIFATKRSNREEKRESYFKEPDRGDRYDRRDDYRGGRDRDRDDYRGGGRHGDRYDDHRGRGPSPPRGPPDICRSYSHTGESRLEAIATAQLTREQMYRIFDIVPGLDYCDWDNNAGMWVAKYNHPGCSSYARDKLDGFEYPPGYMISVRLATATSQPASVPPSYGYGANRSEMSALTDQLSNANGDNVRDNLQALVQSIQKATSVLQSAGLGGELSSFSGGAGPAGGGSSGNDQSYMYTSINLPPKQNMASRDAPVGEVLFIVSQPISFPEWILSDLFCRYGGCIEAYFHNGRNYGYVKYSSKESAQAAINALHGTHISGQRLKVMVADPSKMPDYEDSPPNKRPRT